MPALETSRPPIEVLHTGGRIERQRGLEPPTSPGGGAELSHSDYLAKDQLEAIPKLLYLLK